LSQFFATQKRFGSHRVGIGKGFVATYLLRPNHIVIAAVRDPSHSTSKSLSTLPTGTGSSLIVIPLDSSSETSIFEAIDILKSKYFISTLDVVIANAGIAHFYGTALQTPIQGARDHYNVNTLGALALFQATYPLLSAASKKGASIPKFVPSESFCEPCSLKCFLIDHC
jgi:norsolorinic acid ketoreductase